MIKKEIRTAFGEALRDLGKENPLVVAFEADVGGSTKSALFGKEFPSRYFNVGIAELNMISMASGMATCGLVPFVNTFAVFMTLRGGDPIQSLVCYDNLNVKLAGTYCGLSDAFDGASHHAIGDMALMRALPNMTVISVCDAVETRKAVYAAAAHNGPVYLRLSRAETPVIFDDSYSFKIGKGVKMAEGRDLTIIATGYMVQKSLEAAELLKAEGISARVVNIHTIKPIDAELITACARETGAIVTAEEHLVTGGLGSAVCEVLAQNCPVPVELVGLHGFAESGPYEPLLDKYSLGADAIAAKARAVLKK